MTTTPHPLTIEQLGSAAYPALAMVAAMQLDLFTPLGLSPRTAEQLAQDLGVGPAKLRPLLYALVDAGLLLHEEGRFANSEEAHHFLVKGKPSYLGGRHAFYSARYNELMKTAESIRTGLPAAKLNFSDMAPDRIENYLRGLHPGTLAAGRDLAARVDFSSRHHLLDVGGGSGGMAVAIAMAHSSLRFTVMELPSVAPITRRFLDLENMGDRGEVISADVLTDPLPGTYDVAILRAFIQTLSPEEACTSLRKLFQILEPGGDIHLLGQVLDDTRLSPQASVNFNLVFLNVYDQGQAYTEGEYRTWLQEAGFQNVTRLILPGGQSLVSARRPF